MRKSLGKLTIVDYIYYQFLIPLSFRKVILCLLFAFPSHVSEIFIKLGQSDRVNHLVIYKCILLVQRWHSLV